MHFGIPAWCGNYFGIWGWFWPIIGFVIIIALIVGTFFIIRNSSNRHRNKYQPAVKNHNESGSIKILNERYAKGEISHEEYLKRKKIIRSD
ncbi:MAG: hypothetical protein FXF54_08140 [Kosmotoga sp.]|nr:MAG: hypothetical protein FXF54_08140 [Kosmotoga sp.]